MVVVVVTLVMVVLVVLVLVLVLFRVLDLTELSLGLSDTSCPGWDVSSISIHKQSFHSVFTAHYACSRL